MPATAQDYQQIKAAQARARQLGLEAAQLSAGSKTFEDEMMNRVRAWRAQQGIGQMAQAVGTTTGQLVSEGPALRERTMEVNPLDVDRMLAAQRGQNLATLTTLAQTEAERTGTIEDIIGAGTNRLMAQAQIKQAEQEMESQTARDLMDLIKLEKGTEGGGLTPYQQFQIMKWMAGELGDAESITKERDYAIEQIQQAISYLDKRDDLVGPINGRLLPLKSLFDKEAAAFYRITQKLATKEMFNVGGKVLPAQELARLNPYLPSDMTKRTHQIKGDLELMAKEIENTYNKKISEFNFAQQVGQQYNFLPSGFTPTESEWEIYE